VVGADASLRVLTVVGVSISLAVYLVNLRRLARDDRLEHYGTWTLTRGHLRPWFVLRMFAGAVAVVLALVAPMWSALVVSAVAEVVGRWLFYVSVVPLNMPGGFFRPRGAGHQ
jgi:hypothetical protein